MSASAAAFMPDTTAPVEQRIVVDMIKRSVWIIPVLIIVGALFAGPKGAASTAFAVALIVANFALSAVMLSQAAKVSFAALGVAAMFGFLIRLGLITIAVLAVRNQSWVSIVTLGVMIVVTHLALLLWELRFVSLSFSSPGVREESQPKISRFANLRGKRSNKNVSANPTPVKE